jgi:hypothetical protein
MAMRMIKKEFPKTKQGLTDLLITAIASFETTYMVFCKELEAKGTQKEKEYFCNNRCAIHKQHNSQQLLCLPYSTQNFLKTEGGDPA